MSVASLLDCRWATPTPSAAAVLSMSAVMSARVAWPYLAGFLLPSRLRFDPCSTASFIGGSLRRGRRDLLCAVRVQAGRGSATGGGRPSSRSPQTPGADLQCCLLSATPSAADLD